VEATDLSIAHISAISSSQSYAEEPGSSTKSSPLVVLDDPDEVENSSSPTLLRSVHPDWISTEKTSPGRNESFQVIIAPAREATSPGNKSVFFSGSVKSSEDCDRQEDLAQSLLHLPVIIFNSRRFDWDDSWVEDIQDLRFPTQVEWEHDYMKDADLVIPYSLLVASAQSACWSSVRGKNRGRKGTDVGLL
jgi:Nucleoside 2-deoxyribosyltransferase like